MLYHYSIVTKGICFMNVLIVEDDKKTATFIRHGLKEAGIIADMVHHGDEGYAMAKSGTYDAMVLDIMLPGRDGLSILKNLREKKYSIPIILLTARCELDEKVKGLQLGADDYLIKPFSIEELIARLQTITRRTRGDPLNVIKVEDLSMDLVAHTVTRGTRSTLR